MPDNFRFEPAPVACATANDEFLDADASLTARIAAPGALSLNGQIQSSGSYSVDLQWTDRDGQEIRRQNGVGGGTQTGGTFLEFNSRDMKGPWVNVIVNDESGTFQTVNLTLNTGA